MPKSGSRLNEERAYGKGATLHAPFPWFGGKRAIAAQVWQWLGDVPNYVEPFFGSGAVLLQRPDYEPTRHTETINDADGLLCNFWRAVTADPEAVAHWADWPVIENDVHARHAWLVSQKDALQARLEGSPEYYDAQVAGWWVWGLCCWIGRGWCSGDGPWQVVDGQLVHRGDAGQGIHRQRVHLGDAGQGIREWFAGLQARLRRVRQCCGDWQRVCGFSTTTKLGCTGVFLDPPYSHALRDRNLYRVELDMAPTIQAWCLAHGADPLFRIVLCGYGTEHDVLLDAGWRKWTWTAHGGYGTQGQGRGRTNATLEACWVSPHCLDEEQQPSLFGKEIL